MLKESTIKIKPIITVVCDEVRMENNGKPFIVGIYLGGIIVNGTLPSDIEDIDNITNMDVYLWMPFEASGPGIASFEIKIMMPNPKHQLRAKAKVIIDKLPQPTEITPLVLGPFPLKLWQNGELQILFKHEDESDYQTLRTIPVTFKSNEASAINEIEQLSTR